MLQQNHLSDLLLLYRSYERIVFFSHVPQKSTHLMSAPALRASMKALVPDLAMVPKLLTRSALVMPIPESSIVKVLLA